ncbi:sulfonate transport system substrate-binding protein [Anaerobacterium chartisolvens]|uniref:Sulfonate transport system substrate-binding protein n=1 Tax=Anaerobacterium chartisolvens TaxID=1297424 RepID=A0A369BEW0_9FIRM|nr:NrtA/SsuA/CpmA family ABC transporter substrate-binding protein [Anaerobacterium chartisolvens]RCX20082.1 sulfonate transport system substrate-binding protein [Anaerobacterium chartisolvens]
MRKRLAVLSVVLITLLTGIVMGGCGETQKGGTDANGGGKNEKPSVVKINVSHQPYSHGLPSYVAQKEGWFKEAGLDANILFFTSGPSQNEALGADQWEVGAMGSPPAILGGVGYNSHIIAFAVDDTVSVDYWVRPDSPIAKVKGEVKDHPDIYGTAELWKGKTILCPTATSAHFMLIATLDKLGLTVNDVKIVHMEVPQAFAAFKAGQGDIVALWSPINNNAPAEGWVKVSSGLATGEVMPTVIVASDKAIKERPDAVKKWLEEYFKACDKLNQDINVQAKFLLQMQTDNGIKNDEAGALKFVEDRPLPTLDYEAKIFKGEYGKREVDTIMEKIIDFFIEQGTIKAADKEKLLKNNFIDGQFIQALTQK